MTPTNSPSGAPTPKQPLWKRILSIVIALAVAYYMIFQVAIPDYKARNAELNGPSSPSSPQ